MALEDDLRHQAANDEARQRSIDHLGPIVRACHMLDREMSEQDWELVRDRDKRWVAKKKKRDILRENIKGEVFKWGITAALGGLGLWLSNYIGWAWHFITGSGSGKP